MTRAYAALFAIAVVAALALSAVGRRPHHEAARTAGSAPVSEVSVSIEVGPQGVSPERLSVPKDHRVRLTIVHRAHQAVSLRLAGYQDRVSVDSLAPGETRVIEFLADRPGEDFTWLVNGQPSGFFLVTGSHLIGGHR